MIASVVSNHLDFEKTCRLCVKESSDLNPICHSENQLNDLIKECVDIEVRNEDELPKHVCQECLMHMESWKSFKTACQKSEDFLHSYIINLHCSVSMNETEQDTPNSQDGSQLKEEESPSPIEKDPNPEHGEKLDEEEADLECDDGGGSSTDSAEGVECIGITKDEIPKKNLNSVIRLDNVEAFKLLINAQFLEPNRNLYKASDSEDYFACTADKVVNGQDCLLLELEKNAYCEVEFVENGHSFVRSGDKTSEGKDDAAEPVEVETILTEPEDNTMNLNLDDNDSVSYIIVPENPEENTVICEGLSLSSRNKKDENASILHSILKSNNANNDSSSKEALMFHKYARPASEKAVKFLIPGSSPSPRNNVTFLPPPSSSAQPVYQVAVPPSIQVLNHTNLMTAKGIKRSFSEPQVGVTTHRKQKVLLPAPSKPMSSIHKLLQPTSFQPKAAQVSSKQLSKPIKRATPKKDSTKFGSELKSVQDISQRIQQIIEANEEILQKTWGQYRKEEEDEDEVDEPEEVPQNVPEPVKVKLIPSGTGFLLEPIQTEASKVDLKLKNVISYQPESLKGKKLSFEMPVPRVTVPVSANSYPKVPIPKLPIPRLPTVAKPALIKPKAPTTKTAKPTKDKTIDEILFEGLDMEETTTNDANESTGEDSEIAIVGYTITEEGLKQPTFKSTGRKDWIKRIPEEKILDPATLPKNKQKNKILQNFYLPNEPILTDETSNVLTPSEENEVKDVLFWADQLPDPPKDDGNDDNPTNQRIQYNAAGMRIRRKRKRKPQKKKPKPRIYTCSLCKGIAYAKFYELTQHDKAFHADLPANEFCSTCGKCFIFEDRVKWHSKIYHAEKTMFCDLCGRGFSNKERLSTHKKLHSDKFICDSCGYRAPNIKKLAEHKRRHTGEKPYMCEICGMKLASKISVRQHSIKHAAENPGEKWQCKDCEFSTTNMTSFYHHRKRHATVATFLCEQCGQNVLTKSRLYKHMRFAHGPETIGHYECGECNGIFHSKIACDDHLKEKHRMSGEGRSFVCKICFKSYATKAACKKHFKTHNL